VAISDIYTGNSGTVTVASTSTTAAMSLYGTAAKRLWVVGIRVAVQATTAVAGNNVLFQLARCSNSNTGTSTSTGVPHDFSAPASLGTTVVTWSTAPTVTSILSEYEVPQTSGSMWEEFPPSGYEWGVPAIANANANAGVHLFITASVNTSTTYVATIIWSE
jgi:hypothetical protein